MERFLKILGLYLLLRINLVPRGMILRRNLSATHYELSLLAKQRRISATNLRINLTYCNGEFVTVRGFSSKQLIGSPLSIVRYTDVPEVVFARMWLYLKDVKSWMETVKKLCNIGGHYWINLTGYKSVRVKPERNQVIGAMCLDARLKNQDSSLQLRQLIGAVLAFIFPPFVALAVSATVLLFGGATIGVAIAALSFLSMQTLSAHPWHRTLKRIGSVFTGCFDSEQIARPFLGEQGPAARLRMLLISEGAKSRNGLSRIGDFANQTAALAINSQSLTKRSESILSKQRDEVDIAATAIESARAGEQDCGFTVVVDKSMELPLKTQGSTKSIQRIILPLKGGVDQAVEVTCLGSVKARSGVKQVISTQGALDGIEGAVERIHQVSKQMAAASEQQAHVVEEISRQITRSLIRAPTLR